jgi:hypothetical protein
VLSYVYEDAGQAASFAKTRGQNTCFTAFTDSSTMTK